MGTIFPQNRMHQRLLVAIIVVAALLRFQYLFQIEHNVDHAYPIWQALRTLDHGEFPIVGQGTSVLFANPALAGYLYLPFVALTRSPLGTYIFLAGLNTLAVFLVYRTAAMILDDRSALIAAGLMAVNPWVIEYSRASWVQGLLPFFVSAIAWLLWPVLLGKSRQPLRRTVLALIMLTLMTQTYLLSYALVVPVGVLIFIFRHHVPRPGLLIGGIIFVLATGVYIVGLLEQWASIQQQLAGFRGNPLHLTSEAWNHALRLVTGADYALARGIQAPADDSALRHSLSQLAHWFLLLALVFGGLLALRNIIMGNKREVSLILLLWFGFPVAMMTYVNQPVHPFYQLLSIPAGFILTALGLNTIFRSQSRITNIILLLFFFPFSILMGTNSARYYQETATIPGAHDLGALPLDYGLKLGAKIVEYLPEGGVVYADVDEWTLNSFAGQTFPVVRDTRAPAFSFVPHGGGLYIVAHPPETETTTALPLAERVETLILPDGWTITVDLIRPDKLDLDVLTEHLEIPSDQGLTLCCYQLEQDANCSWTLTSYWRVDNRTPLTDQRTFTPYAHIFDPQGERIMIVDGQPVPGQSWRVGDFHVHRMTFDGPDEGQEPYTVKLGQFDAGPQETINFRFPDGSVDAFVTLSEQITP